MAMLEVDTVCAHLQCSGGGVATVYERAGGFMQAAAGFSVGHRLLLLATGPIGGNKQVEAVWPGQQDNAESAGVAGSVPAG